MLPIIKIKDRMIKENHEGISQKIDAILGVSLFDNVRTSENVDARALYCFILRNDLKYTLYTIRDIFNAKGKKFDHSTVYYNIKLFEEVRKRRKDLEKVRDVIMSEIDPKYALIRMIENMNSDNAIDQVYKCLNSNEPINIKYENKES